MSNIFTARVTKKIIYFVIESCEAGIRFLRFVLHHSKFLQKSFASGVVRTLSYRFLSFPALPEEVSCDGSPVMGCLRQSNPGTSTQQTYLHYLLNHPYKSQENF